MNKEIITIQDCIDMYEKKNQAVILNDGKVIDFQKEKQNLATDQSEKVLSITLLCYLRPFQQKYIKVSNRRKNEKFNIGSFDLLFVSTN